MTKLKLLALALILMGPCVYVSTRRGCRPGRAFAPVLCAQSLVLLFLGYFFPFSAVMGVLAAVSAGAWVGALMKAGREKKRLAQLILSPVLVFLVGVFLYDVCSRRVFLSFDEFSHWGILPKVIALFDALPRAGLGAAYIQYTYPPSGAMLSAAAMTLFGARDGMAYFGYALLQFGLLWGLACRVSRGSAGKAVFAAALVYLSIMAIFPLSILRMFIEPLIALLMAHLILGVFDEKEDAAEAALYAVMLAMTKNTGPVFVLLALMIRLLVKPTGREAMAALRMLLFALAGFASYQIYCRIQGIEASISPSHLGENLSALLSGTLDASYATLPARYLHFFFTHSLPDAGLYSSYGFGTSACVMGLLLLLSAAHVAFGSDRRQALRLWGGVWLANLLYIGMIVASYFIGFEPEEVERLAEADRYTMLPALTTGILACAMLARDGSWQGGKRCAAAALAALAVLLPLSHPEMTVKTFITREYVENTIWAQDDTEKMARFVREQLPHEDNMPLLCVGGYNYEQLHYMLAGTCDIGPIGSSWTQAPWSGSSERLKEELNRGAYEYVFVGGGYDENSTLAIDERYAPLVIGDEELRPYSLYRVERGEENGVQLVYVASMTESET